MLRRRMIIETKDPVGKYPLVNGRHEFADGSYVEVSRGNHVKMHVLTGDVFINLSNVFQNTTGPHSYDNINNLPTIFTLPEGSYCILQLKNIQQVNVTKRSTVNFRIAQSNTSLNFNDDIYFSQIDNVIIEREIEVTRNVGCFLLWSSGVNFDLEFDVNFTVNGERWI